MKRILTLIVAAMAITSVASAQIYHGNKHARKHAKHHHRLIHTRHPKGGSRH